MTQTTVLIVDDDDSLRRALAANVRAGGFRVLEAADAHEALDQIADDPAINVVISDIMMPHMNGSDFLERSRLLRPDLPFVMISGYSANELISKALRWGAYTILVKPFDPRLLLKIIRRVTQMPKVLVIDSTNDGAVKAMLDAANIRSASMPPGQATEAMQSPDFDIAIFDRNGAMHEIENNPLPNDLRMIVLSADGARGILLSPARPRVTYVTKPVELDHLLQLLARMRAQP